jgi:hypothetical protein
MIDVYTHSNPLKFWTEWYRITGNANGLRVWHTYSGKPATPQAGKVMLSALK